MKNIHLFETKEVYDAAKSGLILPTVSYIKNTKDVKYNPYNANGHDFVQIAGIKWATMNVGANDVTDYGLYFQWGDTQGYTAEQVGTGEGKKKFASDWSDYKWYDTKTSAFTKYNSSDKKTVLDLEDDAVHAAWGGSWRMPTSEEFNKLKNAVTTEFKQYYNYQGSFGNGLLCTAKDGSNKTLFFTVCGSPSNGDIYGINLEGCYWSSSFNSSNVSNAYNLNFNDFNVDWQSHSYGRYYGQCVRGVLDEK